MKFVFNRIGGIMICMFASSVIDPGFEPQSGQTKDLYLLFFLLSMQHLHVEVRTQTGLLGIRIFINVAE